MTSFRLAERTAPELFVRDLARLLHACGTSVAVFAPRLGPLANDLRQIGIEVAGDPLAHSFDPDLIHGQGNVETVTALLAHPGVPAVFFTEGGESWRERPPLHPRIFRYLTVSLATRTWLERERQISPLQISAIPLLVDTSTWGEPRRVPLKPETALYFDDFPGTAGAGPLLRRACAELRIRFDTASDLIRKAPLRSRPDLFSHYDLVFAEGSVILEALAAGCGVIPVGHGSFGDLITTGNFDRLSATDFSTRRNTKQESVMAAELAAEIAAWDWRNLSPLAAKVRNLHGTESVCQALREIYEPVLAQAASHPPDLLRESRAMAEWLGDMTTKHQELDLRHLELQRMASALRSERIRLDAESCPLQAQLEVEKEKVRFARRLLQDGSLLHHRLRSRIEEGWREIEERNKSVRDRMAQPVEKPSVDLSG